MVDPAFLGLKASACDIGKCWGKLGSYGWCLEAISIIFDNNTDHKISFLPLSFLFL